MSFSSCQLSWSPVYITEGVAVVWGSNKHGQLGLGTQSSREEAPKPLYSLQLGGGRGAVVTASCGGEFTVALLNSGQVFSWGYNKFGQLGLGDVNNRTAPCEVTLLRAEGVIAIACGGYHTLAKTDSGIMYSWGAGDYGQLGLGTFDPVTCTPHPIPALGGRNVTQISCGAWHSAALYHSGELYTWGNNEQGQLGLGDLYNRNTPQLVSSINGPVAFVSCGCTNTFAVRGNGVVFSWGNNEYGQLGFSGNGTVMTPHSVSFFRRERVVSISCGISHTVALLKSGDIVVCGSNRDGELGMGDANPRSEFSRIPQLRQPVKAIQCGAEHTYVLLESGTVLACGNNKDGQLGLGDVKNRPLLEEITALRVWRWRNPSLVCLLVGWKRNTSLLSRLPLPVLQLITEYLWGPSPFVFCV
ncbi:UVB-resistance 8 [Pelomyxa schiedti]|nr:UVB-resistance 8 [Pelomyxa schiedti]